jgi:hypothetical protein
LDLIDDKQVFTLEEELRLREELEKIEKKMNKYELQISEAEEKIEASKFTQYVAEMTRAKSWSERFGITGKAVARGIGRSESLLAKGTTALFGNALVAYLPRLLGKKLFKTDKKSVFDRQKQDEWFYETKQRFSLFKKAISKANRHKLSTVADLLSKAGGIGKALSLVPRTIDIIKTTKELDKALKLKAKDEAKEKAKQKADKKLANDKQAKSLLDDNDDDDFEDISDDLDEDIPTQAKSLLDDNDDDDFEDIALGEVVTTSSSPNKSSKVIDEVDDNDSVTADNHATFLKQLQIDNDNRRILEEVLMDFYEHIRITKRDELRQRVSENKPKFRLSETSTASGASGFSKFLNVTAWATIIGASTAYLTQVLGDEIAKMLISGYELTRDWVGDVFKKDEGDANNILKEFQSLTTDNPIFDDINIPKLDDQGMPIKEADTLSKQENFTLPDLNSKFADYQNIMNNNYEGLNLSANTMQEILGTNVDIKSLIANDLSEDKLSMVIKNALAERELTEANSLMYNTTDNSYGTSMTSNKGFNLSNGYSYSVDNSSMVIPDKDIVEQVNKEYSALDKETSLKTNASRPSVSAQRLPPAIAMSSYMGGAGLDLLNKK